MSWIISNSFEFSRNFSRKTNWFSPPIQQHLWCTGSTQNTANSTWINHSFMWPVACSFASSSPLLISAGVWEEEDVVNWEKQHPVSCLPFVLKLKSAAKFWRWINPTVYKVRLCHPWNTHPLFILLFLPWTCNLHLQNKRLNHNSPTVMHFYG